jgi:hypothetical protein
MTVVIGAASDLVPTVPFGNVQIGPVTIMRPVVADNDEALLEETRKVQKMAEYVVGSERRIIQWATDPTTRITNPATGQVLDPAAGAPAEPPKEAPAAGGDTAAPSA